MKRLCFACLSFAAFLVIPARATPVLNIAAGACPNNQNVCTATNGVVSAGLFSPMLITDSSTLLNDFSSAFKSWNTDGTWTLKTADLADDAVLTVTLYRAYVNEGPNCGVTCGGAEIRISYIPGANDPPGIIDPQHIGDDDAVWSQAVSTNAKRDPSLPGNPYLDNAPDTPDRDLTPPAYPYQYTGSDFYDKPGRDATAIWIGDAYISTTNYTTKTLTLYEGVEWGFTVVPVPEPSSLLLFAAGGICMVLYRKRRYLLAIGVRKLHLPC
jgi:hypothetical protein